MDLSSQESRILLMHLIFKITSGNGIMLLVYDGEYLKFVYMILEKC